MSPRPTCMSWPSASPATTPPSIRGASLAPATPMTRRASPAARRAERARSWAPARRWAASAPTPADRSRIPCAVNGCAALRPTVGRYAQTGITPISHTRDTAGPMAQTVADLELLDRIISGRTQRHACKPARRAARPLPRLPQECRRRDAGCLRQGAGWRAQGAGVTVVEVDMPAPCRAQWPRSAFRSPCTRPTTTLART